MYKRIFSVLLIVILVLSTSNTGFGVSSGEHLFDTNIVSISEEKIYSNATLEDDFADDRILITLTNEASLKCKEYTAADLRSGGCAFCTKI